MNILQMLEELRSERQQIEEAILVIERLAVGSGRRRGRPPKWMSKAVVPDGAETQPKKKRSVSAAARKRMAAAQKKRWATRKAEAKNAAA